jgi:hypothetical protein
MLTDIDNFLTKASEKGYRTLLMAMKVLEETEVNTFLKKCAEAESKLETREKELANIYSEFE